MIEKTRGTGCGRVGLALPGIENVPQIEVSFCRNVPQFEVRLRPHAIHFRMAQGLLP